MEGTRALGREALTRFPRGENPGRFVGPMPISPGTRLGPYEVLAPIGAGGMGEIHRARDVRLGREVAVKVLPQGLASDPERLARFEREVRAVATLSHPNILAIHDFGSEAGTAYAVTELLAGETLRDRLREGAIPVGKAISFAVQIANGLAAAHDKGIVHRDLKPENLMILPDDRVKILDFGLAKQTGEPAGAGTMTFGTEAGVVLGTVGYMSPEQVRGLPVDARSDIFSLGTVLYEMLSGRRAFRGESPADTMSAILREEPADLADMARGIPGGLERLLARCLEKRPEARFHSAHDLAIALEAISTATRGERPAGGAGPPAARQHPRFKRLTFRNGNIATARFADDGRSVVYGAAWEGKPFEIYSSRPESPESRNLGLPPASLHAISASGEMAISLGHRHTYWFAALGTLGRVSLGGGGVRLLLEGVAAADWSPDGRSMAVARVVGGRYLLEYPAGTTLVETADWLSLPRVSRDGTRVAFADLMSWGDLSATICIVDRDRRRLVLSKTMTSVTGVCWSPDGSEVWYSGINEDLEKGIWAVTPGGGTRTLYVSPARIRLHDVSPGGRVLVSTEKVHLDAIVGGEGLAGETNLSWFDASVVSDLTADGRHILVSEVADAENPHYAVYLRPTDGSAAVRLGEGVARGISPDGTMVLALLQPFRRDLMIYPTGLGQARSLRSPEIDRYGWAGWHPGGHDIFFVGTTHDGVRGLYTQPLDGTGPRLLYDEAIELDWVTGPPIAPDGRRIVLKKVDGSMAVLHTDTKVCEPVPGVGAGDNPVRFDADGRHLFVASSAEMPPRIDRVEIATGARSLWKELRPPDPAGIIYFGGIVTTPDGSRYAYTYARSMSDLYLVEGIA